MIFISAIDRDYILFRIFDGIVYKHAAFRDNEIRYARKSFIVIISFELTLSRIVGYYDFIFARNRFGKFIFRFRLRGVKRFIKPRSGYRNFERNRSVRAPGYVVADNLNAVNTFFPYGIKIDVFFKNFVGVFIGKLCFVVEIADVPTVECLSVFIRKRFETVDNAVYRLNFFIASVFKRSRKLTHSRVRINILCIYRNVASYGCGKIIYFAVIRRGIPTDKLFTVFLRRVCGFFDRLTVYNRFHLGGSALVERHASLNFFKQRITLTPVCHGQLVAAYVCLNFFSVHDKFKLAALAQRVIAGFTIARDRQKISFLTH